jgi:calcineurin-like phosphoesterase family protein
LTIWFSSDLHLGHENIIKYCDRPFKNAEEMDEIIINNINRRVKDDDLFIIVGDVSFHPDRYLDKINGIKWLIAGNHDNKKYDNLYDFVLRDNLDTYLKMKIGRHNCIVTHWPQYYNKNVDYVISGHTHEKYLVDGNNVNIGVDQWDFKPLSFNELNIFLNAISDKNE